MKITKKVPLAAASGRAPSCNANGNQTKTKDDDLVKFANFVDN